MKPPRISVRGQARPGQLVQADVTLAIVPRVGDAIVFAWRGLPHRARVEHVTVEASRVVVQTSSWLPTVEGEVAR